MSARNLPEFSTPWTDPLGVTWCVVPGRWSHLAVHLYHVSLDRWVDGNEKEDTPAYQVNSDLLRGLGRTLPPVPTPKRVAKAAASNGFEYAVKGDQLYWREPLYSLTWAKVFTLGKLGPVRTNAEIVAAAHAAFAGAGDVLPGEEGSDA